MYFLLTNKQTKQTNGAKSWTHLRYLCFKKSTLFKWSLASCSKETFPLFSICFSRIRSPVLTDGCTWKHSLIFIIMSFCWSFLSTWLVTDTRVVWLFNVLEFLSQTFLSFLPFASMKSKLIDGPECSFAPFCTSSNTKHWHHSFSLKHFEEINSRITQVSAAGDS